MTNPKVFEFAKEIGMTPLALMDKIRGWQLPVKSHMSELEPEVMDALKAKLSGAGDKAEDAPKKATAPRKKTPTAAAKEAAAKPVAPTKITKPTKAGASKAATKPAEVKIEITAAPAKAGAVVRRKSKPTEAELKAEEKALEAKTETVAEEAPEAVATPEVILKKPETKKSEEAIAQVSAKVSTVAPAAAATAPTAVAATSAVQSPLATSAETPAPVAAAPAVAPAAPPAAMRKREVAIGNSGVGSQAVPSAVVGKRNIVGRMDLGRVTAPPRPQDNRTGGGGFNNSAGGANRPAGGFAGGFNNGAAGAGFRSKGNLRAGFVQATPAPDFFENDDSRKREDKKRVKVPEPAVKAPVEGEIVPHFDAAEFRKREMVFQPKKKKSLLDRPAMKTQITTPKASKRVVKVSQTMKLADLAADMGTKVTELIKVLMKNGVMANMNTSLDFDTIALIAPEFGFEAVNAFKSAEEVILETAFGDVDAERITRAPVVTVMGHVDHGKTSLLDAIRKTDVAAGEAGGITQHIGAYQVTLDNGKVVTFLDTPGHEAFTAMRARGANVTDIAVIVVAAEDGVMPQTAEAISHAKAAGVPLIIAINKMDKPGANPDKIKQQLTEYEVVPEEWGGNAIFVPVSALKKTGIKELLEQILLVAEVHELKANPKKSGSGTVIESRLEKGRGNVATILVQDGTVKVGQHIVAGTVVGKVKSLTNDRGEKVMEAGPGMPVELLGLDGTPGAGDKFDIVKDEKTAEQVVQIRREQIEKNKAPSAKISLEEIFAKVTKGDVKELNVVLKSDVAGSKEAVEAMLVKLSTPEVKVKIIYSAVGGITENDTMLASTAKGIVIGFNVRPDGGAQNQAKRLGVEIRTYSIVYELVDDMKKAMTGLLTPDIVEKVMGRAEVRNTFTVPKAGTIAGSFVQDGKIQRSNMVRLIRDGKIVFEGKIGSLKRFKDDAREVAQGFECGISIENFNDIKVGDVIEAFVKEEIARELSAPSQEA